MHHWGFIYTEHRIPPSVEVAVVTVVYVHLWSTQTHQSHTPTLPFCTDIQELWRTYGKNFSAAWTYRHILSFSVARMAPMETATAEFEIVPYKSGIRQLQVDLACIHFSNIKGFVMLDVAPAQWYNLYISSVWSWFMRLAQRSNIIRTRNVEMQITRPKQMMKYELKSTKRYYTLYCS